MSDDEMPELSPEVDPRVWGVPDIVGLDGTAKCPTCGAGYSSISGPVMSFVTVCPCGNVIEAVNPAYQHHREGGQG